MDSSCILKVVVNRFLRCLVEFLMKFQKGNLTSASSRLHVSCVLASLWWLPVCKDPTVPPPPCTVCSTFQIHLCSDVVASQRCLCDRYLSSSCARLLVQWCVSLCTHASLCIITYLRDEFIWNWIMESMWMSILFCLLSFSSSKYPFLW